MPAFQQMFMRSGRPSVMRTFAESVIYLSVASSRTINAVVIRDGEQTLEEAAEAPRFEVHVANDGVTGIAALEVQIGKDRIRLSTRVTPGSTFESDRVISRIISHDEGMLVLECR